MGSLTIRKNIWLFVIFSLSLLFLLGLLKDYFFLNINDQLFKLYYQNSFYMLPDSLRWMESFSYLELYWFKFFMSFFFVFLFYLLTLIPLRMFFKNRLGVGKTINWIFGLVFLMALLVYGSYWIFGNNKTLFAFARMLISLLSSPLIFMVVFPFLIFDKQSNNPKSFTQTN